MSITFPKLAMIIVSLIALTMACFFIVVLPAYSQSLNKSRPPVVLIVLDEFPGTALLKPDGSFQKERFPHLNALKNESAYYPYHSAASNFTLRALPAILSGITEREIKPQETLFDDFRKMKYRRLISSPLPHLTHLCQRCIISKNYNYLAGIKIRETEFYSRSRLLAGGINDLKTIKEGDFSFMHAIYPHIPWDRFPDGKRYLDQEFGYGIPNGYNPITGSNDKNAKISADNEILVEMAEQRFLMQAQFVDKIVGSVVKNIKASGNWDKTTLIITSDHGGAFTRESGRRTVDRNETLPEITNVPLFIKGPYQKEGLVSNQKTRAISLSKFILKNLRKKNTEFKGNNSNVKLWQGVEAGYFENTLNNYLQDRQAIIDRSAKRFPHNNIFALNEFYGKNPSRAMTVTQSNQIRINDQEKFNKVKLKSTEMRAGNISGQLNDDKIKELFVTVNGLVAGSGKIYSSNRFNIMVNPKFFREGKNIVKFYAKK